MKNRVYLTAIIGLIIAGFASCNKAEKRGVISQSFWNFDGRTLIVQVEDGDQYNAIVHSVRATFWSYETFAEGSYANGGFTLTLPQTVSSQYLITLHELLESIDVSDRNARITVTVFSAYSSDNFQVGSFYLSRPWTATTFMYADRDVAITGLEGDGYLNVTYNLFLKKGWNIIYETESNMGRDYYLTTTPVKGLKWYGTIWGRQSSPLSDQAEEATSLPLRYTPSILRNKF